jgi:hypothetical protein
MLFKGLFIVMISIQLSTKLTVFKFFMISTYMLNIRSIIIEICKLCTEFEFLPLLELRLRYFYLTFLTNKKWKIAEESHTQFIQLYNEKLEKIDLAQNKAYYESFLKRMEEKLLDINRIYWGMNTFSLLGLIIFLSTLNYLIPDSSFIERFKLDWIFGLEPEVWSDWSKFSVELSLIHGVLITLYLEYMLLSFYLDCRNDLTDMDAGSVRDLLKVLFIKLKCMVDLRENNVKKAQIEPMFRKFVQALEWNPAVRDRKLDASILVASKRLSSSFSRRPTNQKINFGGSLQPILEENSEALLSEQIEIIPEIPEPAIMVSSEEIESEESDDNKDKKGKDTKSDDIKKQSRISVLKNFDEEEDDYLTQLQKQEDEETHNKFSSGRRNTLEGSNIVGLKNLVSKSLTHTNKDTKMSYMTELTTKEEMLILMFKNRYKYLFCKTLNGMLYMISRIAWIPLFYPLVSSLNYVTVGFFICFMMRAKKQAKIFIEEANDNCKLVLIYLVSLWVQAFLHQQLYEREKSEHQILDFYRHFLDSPYMESLKDFIKPIQRETFMICFYWFFIICFAISLIPYFLWMSTLVLFRQSLHKTDTYHYYLLDSFRRRNLVIDYVKWKQSTWHFINYYYKTAFTAPVEVYAMVSMVLFMVFWSNLFMPLLLLTMVVVLLEHFRSEQLENEASRQFTLARQKRTLGMYRSVFWASMYLRHVIDLFGKLGFFKGYTDRKGEFMKNLDGTLLILFLVVVSYMLSDLLETDDFLRESYKIKGYRMLKVSIASMCKAYELNEHKVYCRLVQMVRKKHLDEISELVVDNNNINFDSQAYLEESDIMKIIDNSFDKILQQYLGVWMTSKLKLIDMVNTALIKNVEKYIRQDMMVLFESFRVRNSKLIKPDEINLEDYFEDNMNFFFKLYDKVNRFYTLLSYDNEQNKKQLESAYSVFLCQKILPTNKKWKETFERNSICPFSRTNKRALENATDILFKAIASTSEYASSTNVDSYKVEFKKKGFIQCFFGKTKVILFNLRTSERFYESPSFFEFSLFTIISLLMKIIIDRFDKITALVVILVHVFEGGFTNILIIGVLVFTVFVEESPGRNTAWMLVYASLTLRMLMKRLYFLFLERLPTEFFLGNLDSNRDLLCLILVVFAIQNLKYYSPDDQACSDIENPGQAVVRMTINDDFKAAVGRITFALMRKKDSLNKYLHNLDLSDFEKINLQDFKFIIVKQLIKNKLMLKEFKTNILHHCQRLVKVLRHDYLKVTKEKMDSFFYRNFSFNMRKKGGSYLGIVSFLFTVMNFYILLFFPTLDSMKAGVASFLFENRVTAFTVLNFTIYLSFFIFHFLLDGIRTKDTAGLRDQKYIVKLMKGKLDHISYKQAVQKPGAKFRNGVKTLQNVMRLMNTPKSDFNLWTDSPLFYLYISNLIMWVYLNFSVYFWHAYHGNDRSDQKTGLGMFICEPEDNLRESGESNIQPCRNYNDRIESQIFYLINTIYIVVCMYQIRDGQQILKSKITDLSGKLQSTFSSIYRMIPMLVEAECTFKFCSTHTSLVFTDFILIKEIENIMINAKMLHMARMETKTGRKLQRRQQICLGTSIVAIVVGVLCLPLYIFYDNTSKNYFPIMSANFTVDLCHHKKTSMLTLMSMTKLFENRELHPTLDQKTIDIFTDHGLTRKYPLEQIRVRVFNCRKLAF